MSETKPPNELDELTMPLAWGGPYGASIEPEETRIENDKREKARAELAQLREQAAAYQNVMHELCRLPELNMSNYDSDQVAKLNTGVNNLVIAEIAAGRFVP